VNNADAHLHEHGAGLWRVSSIFRRCSRFFGHYAECKLAITAGEKFFDTQFQAAGGRPGSSQPVCSHCANSQPLPRQLRRSA
jgi:hypothetical protein